MCCKEAFVRNDAALLDVSGLKKKRLIYPEIPG